LQSGQIPIPQSVTNFRRSIISVYCTAVLFSISYQTTEYKFPQFFFCFFILISGHRYKFGYFIQFCNFYFLDRVGPQSTGYRFCSDNRLVFGSKRLQRISTTIYSFYTIYWNSSFFRIYLYIL